MLSVFVCWIFVFYFSTTIQYFVQAFMDLCCCVFLVLLRNFYSTHTQPTLYCRHTDRVMANGEKRDEKVWKALQNVKKKVNPTQDIYVYVYRKACAVSQFTNTCKFTTHSNDEKKKKCVSHFGPFFFSFIFNLLFSVRCKADFSFLRCLLHYLLFRWRTLSYFCRTVCMLSLMLLSSWAVSTLSFVSKMWKLFELTAC